MPDRSHNQLPVSPERETHLLDYLHVLQRRWRIALLVALLVLTVVTVKTFLETPVYEANVTLRVSLKPDTSQEVLEKRKERYFSIDSEIEVLHSYKVAERAARLLQQGLPVEGAAGGATPPATALSLEDAVAMVSQGVQAYPVGDQVSMIALSVQREDPQAARDVANAIALAYQELSREQKIKESQSVLDLIDQQVVELGRKLSQSEQGLEEFRIRTGLKRLTPEGVSMVDTAVALEKAKTALMLKKQRIEEFLRNPGFGRYESTVVDLLPGVPELMSRLLELQSARADLLREYTEAYPGVAEVDDKIRLLKMEIAAAAELALRNLDAEIVLLDRELVASERRLQSVPEEELELARLSRTNAVDAQLYSYLLQRQQEERIIQASISGNVEIISLATLPTAPVKPNKKKNLAMGLGIGLLFGIGLAFFLEYLDQTVKNDEDVQERFGLTVLGAIPRIGEALQSDNRQLVTHLEPHSLAAEAFLALRTNILFMLTNKQHKTLMLTSCLPDEGKSTVAVNLAATMAQTGARTLLVGCDLRRPSLFAALGETSAPGLTDLLIDSRAKALRRIEPLGLDFIPAGTEPPNPTQLLSSPAMKSFLDSARRKYDFVILDVPPLIPVADALILASWVDLNVLVLEPCRVPQKLVQRAIDLLHNHQADVAGVVLNDKSGRSGKYYGGYGYYDKAYQGYYKQVATGQQTNARGRLVARLREWLGR
ncbi:MAG: polysaccharide biosynthesis tyrosine autokinase [Desulfuromonadales bacterium]|nr:polysaccharide biosynthesis tyrosine autokinase [Desulfuromonadales bacterium]